MENVKLTNYMSKFQETILRNNLFKMALFILLLLFCYYFEFVIISCSRSRASVFIVTVSIRQYYYTGGIPQRWHIG